VHIFPLTSSLKVPFPECLEIKAKPDWRPNYFKKTTISSLLTSALRGLFCTWRSSSSQSCTEQSYGIKVALS